MPPTSSAVSSPLTVAEYVRVGLVAATGGGVLFSLATAFTVGWEEGMLCLVGTAALVAATLPLVLRPGADLVEPTSFVALLVAVGVTFKTFYLCFGPAERLEFLLLGKQPADCLFAALVIAFGLMALSTGYLLGDLRWRVPALHRLSAIRSWDERRYVAVAGALVVVGLISFVLFSSRLGVSFDELADLSSKRFVRVEGTEVRGAGGYARWGATFIEVGFHLVFIHWAVSRKPLLSRAGGVVVALALAASVYPIFTSSRATILLMLLRMVIAWMLVRGAPSPRTVMGVVGVGLVLLSSMAALRRGVSDLESLGEALRPATLLEVTVGSRSFLDLSKTTHVIEAVPEQIDYQYGKTLVTWLAAPIPRELWPEKPVINLGTVLGPVLFDNFGGVPPGIVGELYLNFGFPGVVVGLLGFGFVLRSLYSTMKPHFSSPAVVLVYALLSTRLTIGMGTVVSGTVARLLKDLVPLLVALWLIDGFRRGRPLPSETERSSAPAGPPEKRTG